MQQYNILEEAEAQVSRVRVLKKQVWDREEQKFVPRIFVRVLAHNSTQLQDTTKWLRQEYGSPTYQGTWWSNHLTNEVFMSDSLYTFWKLKYDRWE